MTERLDFYTANPEALKAMMALEKRIHASGFDVALTQLVRLRVSQINGCAYCVDLHAADARKAGVGERAIASVCVWRDTPFFDERQRAALAWAEAVTLVAQTHVLDEVWGAARSQFSDAELVDLSLLVIAINGWNRLGIAFRKHPS
jgi:AhpD family alkylhydroperoxidase